MVYICYKPKGPCIGCEHFRYDEDRQRNCCWAAYDEKRNIKTEQPIKTKSIKEDK